MEKRFFHFLLAISMFSSVVACSEKEQLGGGKDSLYPVTFTIQTEGRLATRANISDGSGSDVLYYRVKDTDSGEWVTKLTTETKKDNSRLTSELTNRYGGHTVTLSLPKGRNYKISFWAQNSECTAYSISDDMVVTVNYYDEENKKNYANNDETRDAFFGSKEFSLKNTDLDNLIVVLKRPFAQLNVGSTDDDWDKAKAANLTVTQSSLTVSNVATSLNVVDGTVSGDASVTYTFDEAAIPGETLYVDMDKDGKKEAYHWLSMSYLLPNDSGEGKDGTASTTVTTSFTFSDGSTNTSELGPIDYIPLQRNWRTNIIGQVLTGNVQFFVVIDKDYEDDKNISLWDGETYSHNVEDDGSTIFISSAEDFAAIGYYTYYYMYMGEALEYNMQLKTDLNLVDFNGHDAGSICLGSNYDHVFDGNGHTLYCGATVPFYIYANSSNTDRNVTIKNLTIKNSVLSDYNLATYGSKDLINEANGISSDNDNGIGAAIRIIWSLIYNKDNTTTITFDNVHFVNTKITSNSTERRTHIGSVIGNMTFTSTINPVTVILKDCTVEDCAITVNCTDEANREYYIGGIVGSGYSTIPSSNSNGTQTVQFEGTNTVKNLGITINYYNSNKDNIYRDNYINGRADANPNQYAKPTVSGEENLTFTNCNWYMNNLETGEKETIPFVSGE